MNRSRTYKKIVHVSALAALLVLPGCSLTDWFKKRVCEQPATANTEVRQIAVPEDGSKVIVSMEGAPLVTEKSLTTEKNELIESNPQLKSMIALMDEKQLDRNLVEGLTNRAIVTKYVQENRINDSPEYKKEFSAMMRSVQDMLNTKYFTQAFPVTITDAEVQEFYNKNKDVIPNLRLSSGGVKAVGIPFETEKAAKDFVAKAKEAKGDLQRAAQTAGIADKVKDFKMVNEQSGDVEPMLRDKISMMKTPSVDMFKINDKTFWVVSASGKEESKYRPFEQIKMELKQVLEKERMMERFDKEIARLKDEYKIKFNDEFFKDDAAMDATKTAQIDEEPAAGSPVTATV